MWQDNAKKKEKKLSRFCTMKSKWSTVWLRSHNNVYELFYSWIVCWPGFMDNWSLKTRQTMRQMALLERERESAREENGRWTRGQRMEADDEVFTVDVTLICKQPVRSQEGRHYYEHRHSVTSSKMKQMWDERDSWPLKGQFTPKHSGL